MRAPFFPPYSDQGEAAIGQAIATGRTEMASKLRVASILAIAIASANPAFAFDRPDMMKTLGFSTQPMGHYDYCEANPAECDFFAEPDARPQLTDKLMRDLVEVNAEVNAAIRPVTDRINYGVEEHWVMPTDRGDCEDYALLKRRKLIERGWPQSSLLIAAVLDLGRDGRVPDEGHAVLVVRTTETDYILDNLSAEVLPWKDVPYRFLKRQSEVHAGRWMEVEDYWQPSLPSLAVSRARDAEGEKIAAPAAKAEKAGRERGVPVAPGMASQKREKGADPLSS
jgi:predicted transglutaminase-like cysteine proteinase